LLVVTFPVVPLPRSTPLGEPTRTSTVVAPVEDQFTVVLPSPVPSQTIIGLGLAVIDPVAAGKAATRKAASEWWLGATMSSKPFA